MSRRAKRSKSKRSKSKRGKSKNKRSNSKRKKKGGSKKTNFDLLTTGSFLANNFDLLTTGAAAAAGLTALGAGTTNAPTGGPAARPAARPALPSPRASTSEPLPLPPEQGARPAARPALPSPRAPTSERLPPPPEYVPYVHYHPIVPPRTPSGPDAPLVPNNLLRICNKAGNPKGVIVGYTIGDLTESRFSLWDKTLQKWVPAPYTKDPSSVLTEQHEFHLRPGLQLFTSSEAVQQWFNEHAREAVNPFYHMDNIHRYAYTIYSQSFWSHVNRNCRASQRRRK